MHSVCAGLSRAEMQCLKSRDRKISFYCSVCSDFKQKLKNLHNFTSLVHDLQNEIKELKKKTASGMDMDIFDREAVIQEVMDRDRREENIIFLNVPEETSGDKNCQVAADVVTYKNILSTLDVVLTGLIRPIRLGSGGSIGGGVLSVFTEKLSVAPVNASTLADFLPLIDIVICKCKMSLLMYIVNLYIPPNIRLDDYETFIDALGIFLLDKQCILFGDFNAPGFNMPDLDDRRTSSILLLMETLNLRQLNDITSLNGKLLDLVLTNLDVAFAVAHDLAPFVGEDLHHPALDILISLDLPSDPLDFPSNTNLR
ncbi:hypothetical protein Trydic_g22645 [Trypoxylus dichotomus]